MPHDSYLETEHARPIEDQRVVLVEGDTTVDCHIATSRGPFQSSLWHEPKERVPFVTRPGGASLLGELIQGVAQGVAGNDKNSWDVRYRKIPTDVNKEPPSDIKREFPRLYTVWYRYEPEIESAGWRISKFLGSDPPQNSCVPDPLTVEKSPDLIIIDDKGHRFRLEPYWWNKTIEQSNETTWFLIRTGRPLSDDGMWAQLRKHKAKVIAVITADDIRRSNVLVSRRLSWERTTQDLYREILEQRNPALSQFSGCDFVIVCFTASAVVVIENPQHDEASPVQQPQQPRCWLIYDPGSVEDEEWRDTSKGRIYGYTYCVIAAIAGYLFSCLPDRPRSEEMNNAIKNGLTSSRNLYKKGFETLVDGGVAFPVARIVKEVTDDSVDGWGVVEVPPRASEDNWTLFQQQALQMFENLDDLANEIVKKGVSDLLRKLPFYQVGGLVVADRREIEGFRSIQRLLREYVVPRFGPTRPLSIAVFGPPGAGKSFGIEQLAKSQMKDDAFASLTFNLSQLTTPDDLRGAFHQIRDRSLRGKVPLVFWDEFDSTLGDHQLGWLKFFLTPMQDGRFRDSQIEHFIGRAIFVFAGGTERTMEDFRSSIKDQATGGFSVEARKAKAPDFISRLRGYLNILGLNPTPNKDADPLYVVRRAVILHTLIGNGYLPMNGGGRREIDIDDGVLNALLHVSEYRHGVRSMEAAIAMSLLSDRDRFERSSLPLETQLNLHVDGEEFIRLLGQQA